MSSRRKLFLLGAATLLVANLAGSVLYAGPNSPSAFSASIGIAFGAYVASRFSSYDERLCAGEVIHVPLRSRVVVVAMILFVACVILVTRERSVDGFAVDGFGMRAVALLFGSPWVLNASAAGAAFWSVVWFTARGVGVTRGPAR